MERLSLARSELVLNPDINPRARLRTDVEGLKAQILANGFTDPLWVRRAAAGFEVIDGSRRVQALDELFEQRGFQPDGIPADCFDVTEAQAREMALAANVVRLGLTPADEAESFYRLTLAGVEVEAIAAHYAIPARRVRQRIALGSLPKPILEALRAGRMTIEAAQAFTLSPSPEHQIKTFNKISKDRQATLSAHYIRQALIEKGVAGTDPRARFVGPDDYEEAGGTVTRDLFSAATWFSDAKLLAKLCEAKIEATAKALKDEGWSFVEISPKSRYEFNWDALKPKGKLELTPEDAAQVAKLRARLQQLDVEIDALRHLDFHALTPEEIDAVNAKEQEANCIERALAELEAKPFTPKQMAESGAVIATGGGEIATLRGLIKPSKSKSTSTSKSSPSPLAGEEPAPGSIGGARRADEGADQEENYSENYSEAIRADLALAAQHAVKLAMVTAKPALAARMGLAARILAAVHRGHYAPFNVSHLPRRSSEAYDEARDNAMDGLDHDGITSFADMLAILKTRTPEQLTLIEAVLAADTFTFAPSNLEARAVFDLIDPDMAAETFSVNGEFLKRLSRAHLLHLAIEIDPNFKFAKSAKKDVLLAELEPLVAQQGWLPQDLRGPSYAGPGSNAWADAHAASKAGSPGQARGQAIAAE